MTPDRRDERRPSTYGGPERRGDGSLTPAERFARIERRLDAQDVTIDSMSAKLDRILGAIVLMGAGMPFLLWALDHVFR